MRQTHGFTLIEILIVMGLIAILASSVLVAINPARQFAQARNTQRVSNIHAILNALSTRMAENRGLLAGTGDCPGDIPIDAVRIAARQFDLRSCLVPLYIAELPVDPSVGITGEDYDTGYTIVRDTASGRLTICAPAAAEASIEDSEPYCVTR
ncbi:MAG TPA: type II secretion system protein [Candidatus Paceibacterota bacterium]|jgi:type IV pilus assembly protein PilA